MNEFRYLQLDFAKLEEVYLMCKNQVQIDLGRLAHELEIAKLDASRISQAWKSRTSYEEQGLRIVSRI